MKVAVVIPAYKVRNQILDVVNSIPEMVSQIYVVDDKCPESSGEFLNQSYLGNRLRVIFNEKNLGVGGAVKEGYKQFLKDDRADIIVKLDGDGQMDPNLIQGLIESILINQADYAKGNRFNSLRSLKGMPKMRLFGNSVLSFINKFVNGYWHIMDPTNGFTAIHKEVLSKLELDKIDNRYFFESDMLFRLSLVRARVVDYSMHAFYADEESSLRISRILFEFPPKYFVRFMKRIGYNYFLRDFNAGSLQLFIGSLLFLFGVIFGVIKWVNSINSGIEASAGTIMLSALPVILGFQLLLGFLNYDIQSSKN
jgi:glycosyltransferase involved in cell wall biosynthesis